MHSHDLCIEIRTTEKHISYVAHKTLDRSSTESTPICDSLRPALIVIKCVQRWTLQSRYMPRGLPSHRQPSAHYLLHHGLSQQLPRAALDPLTLLHPANLFPEPPTCPLVPPVSADKEWRGATPQPASPSTLTHSRMTFKIKLAAVNNGSYIWNAQFMKFMKLG